MLERTDTAGRALAPVEGDSKRWARVKVVETVIAAVEAGMRATGSTRRGPTRLALAVRLARLLLGARLLARLGPSRWRRGARAVVRRRSASALAASAGRVRRASREIQQPIAKKTISAAGDQ